MKHLSKWIFVSMYLLMAIGLGFFLRFGRGLAVLEAIMYAFGFSVILLVPLMPDLIRSIKGFQDDPQSGLEILRGLRRRILVRKRLLAGFALFISGPLIVMFAAHFSLHYLGYFPMWIPLAWLVVFVIGLTIIFGR